eukprot:Skav228539  [mRNA]  locus=scaffold1887:294332:300458:+ [translate_table: standard]
MGGLLDKPLKEKGLETGGDERMQWVAADMQGWRQDMEDEHIACTNAGEEFAGCGVYCVFDGHGGKAVSKFCKQHFLQELVSMTSTLGKPKFGKNKNKKRHCGAHLEPTDMEEILKESFHKMDDMLRDPAFAKAGDDMLRTGAQRGEGPRRCRGGAAPV